MLNAKLYDAVWRVIRANLPRNHKPLSDEGLWHRVYVKYIAKLPFAEIGADRDTIIEAHLRIVGDIAGQIVWKRCPKSFGIWNSEAQPSRSHVALVREVAAFGVLGLFVAADRFDPANGTAFSTYANFWIKKLCRLYLEELVSIVPRNDPERRAIDIFDAAIERRHQGRGKAAGGMPIWDQPIVIPGKEPGDKEIETVGSDGPTINAGFDYLQRRVTYSRFPWIDMGAGCEPRFQLPGHQDGKASDMPAQDTSYELPEEPGEYTPPTEGQRPPSGAIYSLKWPGRLVCGEHPIVKPCRPQYDPYDRKEQNPYNTRYTLEEYIV